MAFPIRTIDRNDRRDTRIFVLTPRPLEGGPHETPVVPVEPSERELPVSCMGRLLVERVGA